MLRFRRYVSLLLLVVLAGGYSVFAFAEDYYWIIGSDTSLTFPSAADAITYLEQRSPNARFDVHTRRETTWSYRTYRKSDGGYTGFGSVNRRGTACSPPAVYNPETGGCEEPQPDKCESTVGNVVHHEFRFASLGSDGNPSADPPVTVCKSGCQYSHTFGDFSSKRDFGPPDQLVGSFEYKGNGVSCTPSANDPSVFDQPPAKDPVTKAPEYATNNDCSGWETQPDGTLKRSCNSNTSYKDEGNVDCKGGTAGAGFSSSVKCTPSKNKPPHKSETNVEQETTKKDNPDGSSETTTKTDTTKTECKGTKPCESSSKTETESENTDPDGNSTKNGNCVGDGCNPDKTDGSGTEAEEDGEQGE
ncbi:hypothetical protein RTH74_22690 [Pseudomonas sp. zfem001]|uniref:hypothetical protein n=1 Tax=Pseudomonas sp. zfem001 TaxID=3078196 RepID=UPI0029296842|nr:hypothetical protein [Pseudomonas sp. zfem001]MDU9410417.1 hypothetical protein [Pseudomonas sp. zfem001]